MTLYKFRNKIYLNFVQDGDRKRKSTGLDWNDVNIKYVKNNIIPALENALKTGDSKTKSFKHYSELYLVNQSKKATRSYLSKENHWKRAISQFEHKNVDEITASEIQVYINNLEMKAKSKQPYIHAIKETLHLALMDGIIKYNPAINVRAGKDAKAEIKYFEKEEIDKILKSAEVDSSDMIFNYILIVSSTGIRPEEALALKWSDFRDDCIYISRAKTQYGVTETKTVNGIRKVPFSHNKLLKNNKNIWLFPKQRYSLHLRHQWKRVLERAKVKYNPIKCLRHTFATLSLQNGVPINILSSVLGHSSPKVTLERYASTIKNEQALFDDRLFKVNVNIDVNSQQAGDNKDHKIG